MTTNSTSEPLPEAERRVLLARAAALARPARRLAAGPAGAVHLVFEMRGTSFAVEADLVLEAIAECEVTPVPGVPDFVLGVTPWRGEILPVVDLGPVCGRGGPPLAGRPPLVVVGMGQAACGLAVDQMVGPARIRTEDMAGIEDGAEVFLLGVAPGGVAVIDLRGLLSSGRLEVNEELAGPQPG